MSELHDMQTTDSRLLSKREVKIATVEWTISAFLVVEPLIKRTKRTGECEAREFVQSPFFGLVTSVR